jgi:hypothetical protein
MDEAETLLDEGFKKCTPQVWRKATEHTLHVAQEYDIDTVDDYIRTGQEVIQALLGEQVTEEDLFLASEICDDQ